nr:cell division protein ZapE [Rhodococcus sp. (in: high G+C Gram-positive bacteria)]
MNFSVSRTAFESEFRLDAAQLAAVDELTAADHGGMYLWGPVGRGKTWLLDRYFDGVASNRKKRVHFHSFFRDLHASYFRHGFSIDAAIDELLGDTDLLCFDEFHVHDVADGRLISRMLDALFSRRITLVVTSNYPPDGLLPNPLFHETFVRAIELLKAELRIVNIDGPVDYRSRGEHTSTFSQGKWTVDPGATRGKDQAKRLGTCWTFDELCNSPRSTGDYLGMIDRHEIGAISVVPRFADANTDAVQRFFNLVDVLYDRDVRVDFRSDIPRSSLADGCEGLDSERIVSRLSQLQSEHL